MIGTVLLAGGALYVGISAYRAARERQRRPAVAKWQAQAPPKERPPAPPARPREQMGVATVSLGLATAGALAFSPLSLAAIPPLLYLTAPDLHAAWRAMRDEQRISAAAPRALIPLVCLLNGYYFAPALGFWLLHGQRRLLRRAEGAARQELLRAVGQLSPAFAADPWTRAVGNEGALSAVDALAASKVGERVMVGAGQLIPADGVIVEGSALLCLSWRQQEHRVAHRQVGDAVFAATLVQAGCIHVQVEKIGAETLAARLGQRTCLAVDDPGLQLATDQAVATDDTGGALLGLGAAAALLLNPMSAVALMSSRLGEDAPSLQRLLLLSYLQIAAKAGILVTAGSALLRLAQVDTLVLSAAASQQPETHAALQALRHQLTAIYVLTATAEPFSQRRVQELDADGVLVADTGDEQAAALVQLQQAGRRVCYVGDGTADVQAMQQAAVAISLRYSEASGGDQAQIYFLDGNLQPLGRLWALAKEFAQTRERCLPIAFAPSALNMASVLFLGSGLVTALLLNTAGVMAGLGYVLLPAVDYEPKRTGKLLAAAWRRPDFAALSDDAPARPAHQPQASGQLQPQPI